MPIYEYVCRSCGTKFQLMRSMSRASEPGLCTECGGEGQRVFSVFAAFSSGASGESAPVAGAGGGCVGCAGGSCATCSVN